MKIAMIPPSPVIELLGQECYLRFDRYIKNDTIAITAINADQTDVEYGEYFMTVTSNWEANWEGFTPYGEFFLFPVVVIKNYSENEGIVKALADAGVITPGAYLSGSGGKVEACMLTPLWQEIAKEHLKIKQ